MAVQVLGDLLRVRTLVRQHAAKHDESRTQEYLYAATRGDTSQVQQVRHAKTCQELGVSSMLQAMSRSQSI